MNKFKTNLVIDQEKKYTKFGKYDQSLVNNYTIFINTLIVLTTKLSKLFATWKNVVVTFVKKWAKYVVVGTFFNKS